MKIVDIITIESDAFKMIMTKLDRIELILSSCVPISEKCIELLKNESNTILTIEELADFLKTTPKTIKRYKNQNKIPYIQYGGVVRFNLKDVLNSDFNIKHKNTRRKLMTELTLSQIYNEKR